MVNNCNCEQRQRIMRNGCPANVSEDVTVSVPITVHANAVVGDIGLRCMGREIRPISGRMPCCRPCCDVSRFLVRQRMQVLIPLQFTAGCDVGESSTEFATRNMSLEATDIEPLMDDCGCDC